MPPSQPWKCSLHHLTQTTHLLKAYLHYQELYLLCLVSHKAGLLCNFSHTNGLLSNLSDFSSIDTDLESASSSDTADNSESGTRSCSCSNVLGQTGKVQVDYQETHSHSHGQILVSSMLMLYPKLIRIIR